MTKLLFTIGNLSAGDTIYGVEAEDQFGSLDVYGPFHENDANTFAHQIVTNPSEFSRSYTSIKIVKIELPQAGKRIVRSSGSGVNNTGYEYTV